MELSTRDTDTDERQLQVRTQFTSLTALQSKELTDTQNIVAEAADVTSKVQQNVKGLIHRDAYCWFVPVALLVVSFILVAYWGLSGREEKGEQLIDKIVSGDKFDTIKTLRRSENHEVYFSFYLLLLTVIAVPLLAMACIANRNYVAGEATDATKVIVSSATHNKTQAMQRQQDIQKQRKLEKKIDDKQTEVEHITEEKQEVSRKLAEANANLHQTKERLVAEEARHSETRTSMTTRIDAIEAEKKATKEELDRQRNEKEHVQSHLGRIEAENTGLRQREQFLERDKELYRSQANERSRETSSCCVM